MRCNDIPLHGAFSAVDLSPATICKAGRGCPMALVAISDLDTDRLERAGVVPQCRPLSRPRRALRQGGSARFCGDLHGGRPHRALVELAAGHGVHILCQKPASSTAGLSGHDRGLRCADVRLMIHENWRFRPWYRALRGNRGRNDRHSDPAADRPSRYARPHADGFAAKPYLATAPD